MNDPYVYDTALLGILQREGKISGFLDVVLGFLYRRTDFFHVMKSKEETLGFPPGVAPRLLITAYEKYEVVSRSRDITKDKRMVIPSTINKTAKSSATSSPTREEAATASATAPSYKSANVPDTSKHVPNMTPDVPNTSARISDTGEHYPNNSRRVPGESLNVPDVAVEQEVESDETKHHQASSASQTRREFQENPESHNGAVRDKYRWAQTISDCDLRINIPEDLVKAKRLNVTLTRKRICVTTRAMSDPATLVDLPLAWEIRPDESMWSLIPGDCVHINLEKVQERWWECVFEGEPKINVREIDAMVDMNHIDDGAQATISKLMYNEKQKQLGLPTSDQQKTNDILRKAWDAEGSPFKGTPFDPSSVTMN